MTSMWISFEQRKEELSPRSFTAEEALSSLFRLEIVALSHAPDLDLDALVDSSVRFRAQEGPLDRRWGGVCTEARLETPTEQGLSTYRITVAPVLARLSLRRNHRIFQHLSAPDIARELLAEQHIEPTLRVDLAEHPRLEQRVQYGETDLDFFRRILEEAGITFFFEDDDEQGSRLVLSDRPNAAPPRIDFPLRYLSRIPSEGGARIPCVTDVRAGRSVRTGRVWWRDQDPRRPEYPVQGKAAEISPGEGSLEHAVFAPGSTLREVDGAGGDTPVADAQGAARSDEKRAQVLAERTLAAARLAGRRVELSTNVMTLSPGTVLSIAGHPMPDLEAPLLMEALSTRADLHQPWTIRGRAVPAGTRYQPAAVTPRPVVHGALRARVVGPPGAAIHTDELGRVCVQFPWNREGKEGTGVSCWLRVSQAWAGAAHGLFTVPHVGDEVLVACADGNPDQPLIIGRVHDGVARPPLTLPGHKTASVWAGRPDTQDPRRSNMITLDDARGRERLSVRAARDLVRHVERDSVESTLGDAFARTGGTDRHLGAGAHRSVVLGDAFERVEGDALSRAGGGRRAVVMGSVRHRVGHKLAIKVVPALRSALADAAGTALAEGMEELLNEVQIRAPDVPVPAPVAQESHRESAGIVVGQGRLSLSTSGASIVIDGGDIRIASPGRVLFAANRRVVTTRRLQAGAVPVPPTVMDAGAGPDDAADEDTGAAPGEEHTLAVPGSPEAPDVAEIFEQAFLSLEQPQDKPAGLTAATFDPENPFDDPFASFAAPSSGKEPLS